MFKYVNDLIPREDVEDNREKAALSLERWVVVFLIITHSTRFLKYVFPDEVYVMIKVV